MMRKQLDGIKFVDNEGEYLRCYRVNDEDGEKPQVEIKAEYFTFTSPKEVDEFAKAVKELLKP